MFDAPSQDDNAEQWIKCGRSFGVCNLIPFEELYFGSFHVFHSFHWGANLWFTVRSRRCTAGPHTSPSDVMAPLKKKKRKTYLQFLLMLIVLIRFTSLLQEELSQDGGEKKSSCKVT